MVYQNMQNSNVMFKQFNALTKNMNVDQQLKHKQQLNKINYNVVRKVSNKNTSPAQLAIFNNEFNNLKNVYDGNNYYGSENLNKNNAWRQINKNQISIASIYSMRYAPVVPRRQYTVNRQQQQQKQQQQKQQLRQPQKQQLKQQQQPQKPQLKQQQKQQQQKQQQQKTRRFSAKSNIGNCPYKPNIPRTYSFNTKPLPTSLYPNVTNYNHMYEAFNCFGNNNLKIIKSWIQSSRTKKQISIASVFANRYAPFVPTRHNNYYSYKMEQNRKNQQMKQNQMKRRLSNQNKNFKQQINSNPKKTYKGVNYQGKSNVWESYYVSPRHSMFK